jgi:hypothetical protein
MAGGTSDHPKGEDSKFENDIRGPDRDKLRERNPQRWRTWRDRWLENHPLNPDEDPDDPGTPADDPAWNSANAIVLEFLSMYGLEELGTWAWDRWKKGDSITEIMLAMRGQDEYIARFPGMAELAGRGQAISEQEYMFFEKTVGEMSKQFGIPDGIYNTRAAIGEMLVNQVSPVELQSRMQLAAGLVYSNPNIREAFAQFYGTSGDGAAIAYMLDPERNEQVLSQQYAAANIAGNVLAQNLGQVSQRDAEWIAQMVKPTEQEAQRAAATVGSQRDLYSELIGEREDLTITQGLSATLGASGSDVDAVERRRQQRRAGYSGGGGLAETQTGVSGLGSANR